MTSKQSNAPIVTNNKDGRRMELPATGYYKMEVTSVMGYVHLTHFRTITQMEKARRSCRPSDNTVEFFPANELKGRNIQPLATLRRS